MYISAQFAGPETLQPPESMPTDDVAISPDQIAEFIEIAESFPNAERGYSFTNGCQQDVRVSVERARSTRDPDALTRHEVIITSKFAKTAVAALIKKFSVTSSAEEVFSEYEAGYQLQGSDAFISSNDPASQKDNSITRSQFAAMKKALHVSTEPTSAAAGDLKLAA